MPIDLKEIGAGDKLRKGDEGEAYTVVGNYSDYLIVVLVKQVSHMPEWRTAAESVADLPLRAPVVSKLTNKTFVVTSKHVDGSSPEFAVAVETLKIDAQQCDAWMLAAKAKFSVFDE